MNDQAQPDSTQSPQQVYREQVEKLVQACLQRIRSYKMPTESEPPAAVWPNP